MPSNQNQNQSRFICGTRSIKNLQHVNKIDPHLKSKEKGFLTNLISRETMQNLHATDNLYGVIKDKDVADILTKNRPPIPQDRAIGELFKGNLRFVNIKFNNTENGTVSVSDSDM